MALALDGLPQGSTAKPTKCQKSRAGGLWATVTPPPAGLVKASDQPVARAPASVAGTPGVEPLPGGSSYSG
jgi:hypothetical protein